MAALFPEDSLLQITGVSEKFVMRSTCEQLAVSFTYRSGLGKDLPGVRRFDYHQVQSLTEKLQAPSEF